MSDLDAFSGITRIEPFAGLIIDPPTWAIAHDYHRLHHRLHQISLHGSGIVQGLAVLPSDPPGDSLLIEPGVAVDESGDVIVVAQLQQVKVDARSGTVYLVATYQESVPGHSEEVAEGDTPESRGRFIEGFEIRAQTEPPEPPALELARIAIQAGAELALTGARNAWAPEPNEIDGRFRRTLNGHIAREISVAFVTSGPPDELSEDHLRGFSYLLRGVRAAGFAPLTTFASDGEIPQAEILYVTGQADEPPTEGLVHAIGERLVSGSWLFADSCGEGEALAEGLEPLLSAIPASADELDTEGLVTAARYVFGAPPAGASEDGAILWGPHAVVTSRDYGCA